MHILEWPKGEVIGAAVSKDHRTVAVVYNRVTHYTITLWQLPNEMSEDDKALHAQLEEKYRARKTSVNPPPLPHSVLHRLQRHASTLAKEDSVAASRSCWSMVASPTETVAFLRTQLKPADEVIRARIGRLIDELDDKQFAVRAAATQELERCDALAMPELLNARNNPKTLEQRRLVERLLSRMVEPIKSPTLKFQIRSIEVLEYIGTPEAMHLLEKLASGPLSARLTQEALAAIQRLTQRTASCSVAPARSRP